MSIAQRLRATRAAYPAQFWTLFFGSLINAAGSGLVFPFFSLYFTQKLGYSLTDVGLLFSMYAVVSMAAQMAGGELVDRLGRKPVMAFSLLGGALSNVALGLAGLPGFSASPAYLILVTVWAALSGSAFGPAVNAMVADLIKPEQRTEAYGLLRVVQNLGVAIGPAIGGLIAAQSYLALFVISSVTAAVYGLIVVLFIRETRPRVGAAAATQGGAATRGGAAVAPRSSFATLLSDRVFLAFCGLTMLVLIGWSQMTTTLPVYLNRNFAVTEQWYGLLMSLNATMVVLLQFPITRFTHRFARAPMMALGAALFAAGTGIYAVVGALPLFFLAQAVWTTGEMVAMPVSQAFVADVAPPAMRGRYMGIFSMVWTVAFGIGPLAGGAIIDRFEDRLVWVAAFAIELVAMAGFLALGRALRPTRPPASA